MKNKYVYGACVISLLFVMSGCNFMQSDDVNSEDNNPVASDAPHESQTRDAVDSYYNTGIESGNISACDDIENEALKRDCRYDVALKNAVSKNDISLCAELGNAEEVSACKKEAADIQGPPIQ